MLIESLDQTLGLLTLQIKLRGEVRKGAGKGLSMEEGKSGSDV